MKTLVNSRFYKTLGPFSLGELLEGLDISIPEGSFSDVEMEHAAPIGDAGPADISYINSTKDAKNLEKCNAGACFVEAENAHYIGAFNSLAIYSKYPRADFARVINRLYKPYSYDVLSSDEFEHVQCAKGVVIGKNVKIGKGTSIGPNTVIGPGVHIGENCNIGANTVIEFTDMGDNCTIHNGAILGSTGFGVASDASGAIDIPHVGQVILEDEVSVGSLTTIDRAMFGATYIGKGCKFDNLVQVGHNNVIGAYSMFAAHVGVSGSCNIGKGVIMGGKVGIADHINIGDGAVMAAGSSTMHDVPAGEMWSGFPAKPIREHMREVAQIRRLVRKKKTR